MDEDHDEVRFVCKLCDKRFPSGKALGGHMRSHVVVAAANSDERFEPMKEYSSLIINGDDYGNLSSYGLRENPKKSWRASSSSSSLPFPNEKICKQCGKGFQSLKALCGHMAFHSDKDRSLKGYDYSWSSGSDSDDTDENEVKDPVFVTSSKSKRCKKVVTKPCSLSLTNTNSISTNNSNYNYGSSSVSELDEYEQEDGALCLMMLSKDSANWGGVNSVVESSDDKLETKLSMKKSGIKKVESRNYKDLSYEEKQQIRRNLFREFGYDDDSCLNNKRIRDDDDDSYKNKKIYECLNCNKTFTSFQGLGGHRPCHKKSTNAFIAGGNNEYARNKKTKFEKNVRLKKNKGHECPICFRMFKSGQALGGHKRSHFINGSEDRINHMAATYTDMIDLNLPAPEQD